MGEAKRRQKIAHCHFLIKETAESIAHEAYAALMSNNSWYAKLKELYPQCNSQQLEDGWVAMHWGAFIDPARATLAGLLATPIDEGLKETIFDALCKDATLVRGRKSNQFLMQ